MARHVFLSGLLLSLVLGLSPAGAGPDPADRLRSYDAEVTAVVVDKQGVRTELTGFGPMFGPEFLDVRHGDAQVQIPYSKIRSFRVGELVDEYAPVDVALRTGSTLRVHLAKADYRTVLAGNATFGYYRISIGKIASCTMQDPSRESGLGRRCEHGHLFYNSAWRFCPYDGEPLRPILPEAGEIDGGR